MKAQLHSAVGTEAPYSKSGDSNHPCLRVCQDRVAVLVKGRDGKGDVSSRESRRPVQGAAHRRVHRARRHNHRGKAGQRCVAGAQLQKVHRHDLQQLEPLTLDMESLSFLDASNSMIPQPAYSNFAISLCP